MAVLDPRAAEFDRRRRILCLSQKSTVKIRLSQIASTISHFVALTYGNRSGKNKWRYGYSWTVWLY